MKQDTHVRRQLYVSLGLSEKEAILYDLLLQKGELAAATLEKEGGFKKNTYHLLKSLQQKKLVMKKMKDGKSFYLPGSPEALRDLAKKQEDSAKRISGSLEEMLPEIQSNYVMSVGRPTIRYFEGEKGLREVFADIYAPKDEPVYGAVDLEAVEKVFDDHVLADLIPLRVKNKLFAYSLVGDSVTAKEIQKEDENHLRKTILTDKEKFPLPAEIDVYGDKIAMMSFEKGKFVGMVIENKAMAQSLRSVFKLAFEQQPQEFESGDLPPFGE